MNTILTPGFLRRQWDVLQRKKRKKIAFPLTESECVDLMFVKPNEVYDLLVKKLDACRAAVHTTSHRA